MQTKKFLSLLLALAMMFSLSVTASAAEEEGKSLEGSIVILHTNDVHGGIAGCGRLHPGRPHRQRQPGQNRHRADEPGGL